MTMTIWLVHEWTYNQEKERFGKINNHLAFASRDLAEKYLEKNGYEKPCVIVDWYQKCGGYHAAIYALPVRTAL